MVFYKDNILTFVNENYTEQMDFKDWIMISDDGDSLKNWLKYESREYPDADCVLKQGAPECAVVKLNWFPKTEKSNRYYVDCIFSFATFFKAFLRFYASEYMPYLGQVYENYNIIFSDERMSKFCEEKNLERQVLDELLAQLKLFARNTHTMGNYMPCPDGKYNATKGNCRKNKDRLEKLYCDIIDSSKREYEWNDWFGKNRIEELGIKDILENENLLKFVFNGFKMKKEHLEPYTEYIKCINEIIEERGRMLAGKLR